MSALLDEPYPNDRFEMILDCPCSCPCPELTEDGELCVACRHGHHTDDSE